MAMKMNEHHVLMADKSSPNNVDRKKEVRKDCVCGGYIYVNVNNRPTQNELGMRAALPGKANRAEMGVGSGS